ncbi:hypothetical protein BDF19DRAFT_429900 [Syncephalis fuscata]|nr:hypothetical protein BDF19DRAFT_429900 [Syncephalis fuscata]
MSSVQTLLRNRRLQFALLAVVILLVLTVHLSTREPAALKETNSLANNNSPSELLTPKRPDIPSDHPSYVDSNKALYNDILNGHNEDPPTTADNSDVIDPTKPRHYSLVLIIYSDYRDSDRRRLLRQRFLGISDNLQPCMHANGDILYKFAVQSESMEYGDILELKADNKWEGQLALFRWVKTLKERRRIVTFDYLMYMDAFTVVRLGMYRVELASGGIAGRTITSDQRKRLYLSSEHTRAPDLAILAADTSDLLIQFSLANTDAVAEDLFSQFYEHYADTDKIFRISDKRIYYWENSVDTLPKDVMGVSNVFIAEDYTMLQKAFPSKPPVTCRRITSVFNVAVVTSAHIFDENCMLDAGMASASLKRAYAIRHGYSFVARSAEYAQQSRHKHRGPGWGRLDVIQKVLPKYDWILWTDMDAIIVNDTKRVMDLFNMWEQQKELKFSEKHLILTRVPGDEKNVDPGVMLVRNSAWSRNFIQAVQKRAEYYDRDNGVQRAIGTVMNESDWMKKILVLSSNDHSILSTPQEYKTGDFIVHYSDKQCPAQQVLKATKQLESGSGIKSFKPL